MKSSWTKGLAEDERKELEMHFNSSALLRKRLETILEQKDRSADIAAIVKDGYESPSWAYKQADTQGYRRALKEIAELLK